MSVTSRVSPWGAQRGGETTPNRSRNASRQTGKVGSICLTRCLRIREPRQITARRVRPPGAHERVSVKQTGRVAPNTVAYADEENHKLVVEDPAPSPEPDRDAHARRLYAAVTDAARVAASSGHRESER